MELGVYKVVRIKKIGFLYFIQEGVNKDFIIFVIRIFLGTEKPSNNRDFSNCERHKNSMCLEKRWNKFYLQKKTENGKVV